MKKIAVLWPNQLQRPELVRVPGVQVFEDVGALNARSIAAGLEAEGVQALVCTSGIEAVVKQASSLPMYVVTSGYIDILESLRRLEQEYQIIGKRVALLLHENNAIRLSRIAPFVRNSVTKFTFADQEGVLRAQREIEAQRYDAILTGPTGLAVTRARGLSIPAYSLVYSEESLLDAVAQVGLVLDASHKEILRAKQVQAVIDATPYAILATDGDGMVNLCNQKAADLLSSPRESILSRSVLSLLDDPSWRQVYTRGVTQQEVLVKLGEADYFSTRIPIIQKGHIIGSVGTLQEAEQIQTMEHKLRSLRARGLTAQYQFRDIIFQGSRMESVLNQARIYAAADLTVLIEGETGTGKEMIAQSIHNASQRRSGPFVAINCAALAESLLESELMGYEEGAFTGAKKGGKIGLFEMAHNGTLFLDEIHQLSPLLQSKLLRVLQERTIIRVGGTRMIPVNVRIISASNEELQKKVSSGMFRRDLYYRINILHLRLPPLRDRREDILPLITFFAQKEGADSDQIRLLYESAQNHAWPGNIRELENYVWRSLILCRQGLPPEPPGGETPLPADGPQQMALQTDDLLQVTPGPLAQMEKELVTQIVRRMDNNRTKAAKFLQVTRNTVSSKLR